MGVYFNLEFFYKNLNYLKKQRVISSVILSIILLATIFDIIKRVKLHFENTNKHEEVNSAVVAEGSFLIIEKEKKLTKKGLLYLVDTKVMRNYCFRSD